MFTLFYIAMSTHYLKKTVFYAHQLANYYHTLKGPSKKQAFLISVVPHIPIWESSIYYHK